MPRDISGLKFGKLTAIKLIRTEKTKYNYRYIWLFKCNCGKEKEINAPSVIHGHISSCGCLMYQYDCGNKSYLWKGCGDISARFYHSIKGNARHREIEFDLRIEDIWELFLKQNKRCYFSGEELLFGNMTRNQSLTTASLDRINSSGAYNNENIRWVHKAINGMKWDLSDEKFIYYCQLIVNPMRDKTPSGIEDGNFINTGSWNGSGYIYTMTIPNQAIVPTNKNFAWILSSYWRGQYRNQTVNTPNISIYLPIVTFCNDSNLTAIVYKTYDEETWNYLNNSDYSIFVTLKSELNTYNYSYAVNNSLNISVCITPTYSNYSANIKLVYSSQGYKQRIWYDYGLNLDNLTDTIRIYLINNTDAYLTNFIVKDMRSITQPNIWVIIQKFNYTNTIWINMTGMLTDISGQTFTYLKQYTMEYRLLLMTTANTIIKTYDSMYISDLVTAVDLRTVGESETQIVDISGVKVDCNYNNNTKILTCLYDDPSQKITNITLEVKEDNIFGHVYVCNETQSGSYSGNLVCDLSSITDTSKGYIYRVTGRIVHSPAYVYLLTQGSIFRSLTNVFGEAGLFLAMLITIFLAFLGSWKPSVMVALTLFGIIVSLWIGLINMTTVPSLVIGSILVVAVITIWRLKE